jgi:hypothetical protein
VGSAAGIGSCSRSHSESPSIQEGYPARSSPNRHRPRSRIAGAYPSANVRSGVPSGPTCTIRSPMTSDGSKYRAPLRAFQRALTDGQLDRALTASRELPRVNLRDAAKLLYLMARDQDRRYPKAAARWMSRYAAETRNLTPAMLSNVADALAELEHGNFDAAERLLTAVKGSRAN